MALEGQSLKRHETCGPHPLKAANEEFLAHGLMIDQSLVALISCMSTPYREAGLGLHRPFESMSRIHLIALMSTYTLPSTMLTDRQYLSPAHTGSAR